MNTQNVNKKKFSIGPMAQSILSELSIELNKQETREKIINNIAQPLISDLNNKFYIYYVSIFSTFCLIVLLLIIIIILITCKNKNNN
jgi:hypothetical protein